MLKNKILGIVGFLFIILFFSTSPTFGQSMPDFPTADEFDVQLISFDTVLDTSDCLPEDDPDYCGYFDQANIERKNFKNGDTVTLNLTKLAELRVSGAEPPDLGCDYFSYHDGGELYKISPETGERIVVMRDEQDFFGGIIWPGPGVYEFDVQFQCANLVQRPSWYENILALLKTKVAFAQSFPELPPIATIRFTVTDANEISEPDCCSSVLFLPGIMSSQLYEDEQKRWEPSGEGDIGRLYLDESGKTINNIAVGDVIEEFSITSTALDLNLYKTFLTELADKKTAGIIGDYNAYAYDWRLSLPDVIAGGELANTLRELAQSSKTGKVTIVAHSNGGLLAKELVNEVGGEASDLIDQIVFVGVPQLGTPQAIGALLHGYDTGLPFNWLTFLMSPERARDFSYNSPMSYNLLPHQDYFDNSGVSISTPLITFDDGEATQPFRDFYGSEIDNISELQRFLKGEEGRVAPAYDDLDNPTVVNGNLLQNSNNQITNNIDSTWQAPAGVKIYQIAGVGEQTLAGIQYKEIEFCQKPSKILGSLYCKEKGQTLSYSPVRTLAGDETVIEPSAVAIPESQEVERWWVNLEKYNDDNLNRGHKNLLEIKDIRDFIFANVISTSTDYSFDYLSDTEPGLNTPGYLTATLHSPLALSYKESDGTLINEQNPKGREAHYSRYGEVQLLDIFGGNTGSIQMTGEATGSFTLELEEQNSSGATSFVTYSAIPSSTSTLASIAVAGNSVQNTGPLKVDYEGDGIDDLTLEPKPGEIISVPTGSEEVIELSLSELVIVLRNYIEENISNRYIKIYLLRNLKILEKIDQQPNNIKTKYYSYFFNNSDLYKQIALRQIKNIEGILDHYQKWKILEDTTVSEIKSQLEKIKNKL